MTQTFVLKLAAMPDQATRELIEPWLRRIEQDTEHQVEFVCDREGMIEKGSDLLDLVLEGRHQLNSFYVSYHADAFPLTSGIFGLPFIYPSGKVAAAVGWELVQRHALESEFKDLKLLWILAPGVFDMHFVSRPVHSLEDLRFMKFNVHGTLPSESFAALGGMPISTEGDEMIAFLKRELLDGIVVGWYTPMPYQDFTHYSTGNIACWSTGFPVVMNLETWNSLPVAIQRVFEEASGPSASMTQSAHIDGLNAQRLEDFRKSGRGIYWLPEQERARWVRAVGPVIERWADEMEERGLAGKAIVAEARELTGTYGV